MFYSLAPPDRLHIRTSKWFYLKIALNITKKTTHSLSFRITRLEKSGVSLPHVISIEKKTLSSEKDCSQTACELFVKSKGFDLKGIIYDSLGIEIPERSSDSLLAKLTKIYGEQFALLQSNFNGSHEINGEKYEKNKTGKEVMSLTYNEKIDFLEHYDKYMLDLEQLEFQGLPHHFIKEGRSAIADLFFEELEVFLDLRESGKTWRDMKNVCENSSDGQKVLPYFWDTRATMLGTMALYTLSVEEGLRYPPYVIPYNLQRKNMKVITSYFVPPNTIPRCVSIQVTY